MDETRVFYDGTCIHYTRPKKVNERSLQNLKKGTVKAAINGGTPDTKQTIIHNGRAYSLKSKHKRNIRASICYAFVHKPANSYAHFVTVSFPPSVPNDEATRQEIFKAFVKNIRAYRGVTDYIAVKEAGEKTGLIHYHLVLIAPFTPYKKFNNDLCKILINRGFTGSNNCFTSSSRHRSPIVRTYSAVARYITKYMGKGGGRWSLPCYFISEGARVPAINCDNYARLSEIFRDFPPTWRYINENFAVTKHDRAIYTAFKYGEII